MARNNPENRAKQPPGQSINPTSSIHDEPITRSAPQLQRYLEFSRNRICRGYLSGTCNKRFCHNPHVSKLKSIVFCHDYQNSKCHRGICKFLHYSLMEEEYFREHGDFPESELEHEYRSGAFYGLPPKQAKVIALKRDRNDSDPWDERSMPMAALQIMKPQNIQSSLHPGNFAIRTNLLNERVVVPQVAWRSNARNVPPDKYDEYRDFSSDRNVKSFLVPSLETTDWCYDTRNNNRDLEVTAMFRKFQEEQNLLRRRVEANEIKIAELQACNEHLMLQISQYRINSVQCSRVVNPVTVTNTSTQPNGQTAQVITAVSMAPVQVQATPIVSIAAPQTQIISSNGGPALAITNTSQGQQLTLAQQSINTLSTSTDLLGPPPQLLSTSQITLAPALASAPTIGLAINTSQPLAMSNATQPIISYPIMSHSILPH